MRVVLAGDVPIRYSGWDKDAHFAFFLADHAFVWDGCLDHPIEVEFDGEDFRLVGTLHLDEGDLPDGRMLAPYDWLRWFQGICGCVLRDNALVEQVF